MASQGHIPGPLFMPLGYGPHVSGVDSDSRDTKSPPWYFYY